MHVTVDGHHTLVSVLDCVPGGGGVAWACQVVPVRPSASAVVLPASIDDPTAMHVPAAVQDTLVSELPEEPARVGVVWGLQLLPFQLSASI